jgi:hypothetical protein
MLQLKECHLKTHKRMCGPKEIHATEISENHP